MNAPALTAEYRKVITAKFLDKPCYTCGAKLVEGDYAATNTFSQWYSYCSRCAASFKNQVAALLNRVEDGGHAPRHQRASQHHRRGRQGLQVRGVGAQRLYRRGHGAVGQERPVHRPRSRGEGSGHARSAHRCADGDRRHQRSRLQLRSLAAPGPCQVRQPHQQPAQRCRAHAHRAWPQGCHDSRSRSGPAAAGGRGRSVPL